MYFNTVLKFKGILYNFVYQYIQYILIRKHSNKCIKQVKSLSLRNIKQFVVHIYNAYERLVTKHYNCTSWS